MDSNTSGTFGACSRVNAATGDVLQYVTISLAVLILIGVSFTVQRNRILKNLLWGVPGIVVPVNLLSNGPRRYISMLIFVIISGDILQFFFNHDRFVIVDVSSCYAQAFFTTVLSPLLLICYLSIKFFPLLACVGVVIPILGPALGLLYSILLFSYNTYNDMLKLYCQLPREMVAIVFAVRGPVYVASLIVFLWFFFELFVSLAKVCRKGFQRAYILKKKEVSGDTYYFSCVRHLLKRQSHEQAVRRDTISYKVISSLFPFWLSPHRLPLKFVSAMIVTFFMIYQTGLLFSGLFLYCFEILVSSWKDNKEDLIEQWLRQLVKDNADQVYGLILDVIKWLAVIFSASPVLAMIFSFLLLFHLYITVHKDIIQASQGKYRYLKLGPTLKLSYSWRYPGYQIAFAFTAFIIYTLCLCILGFGGMFVYFAFKYVPEESLCIMAHIIIPAVWVLGVVIFQMTMAKFIFIKESSGKFMALTNQRLLHWVSYFLFIYDAINGLLSALLRAFLTQVVGLLLMIRLDRVVLMRGFECLDIGHKAYIGFLHLNHTYNNPVVHTFVRLLSESSPHYQSATPNMNMRLLDNCDFNSYGAGGSKKRVQFGHTRARNRWLVAYTLIRNPSLCPLTATNLLQNPSLLSLADTESTRMQPGSDPV